MKLGEVLVKEGLITPQQLKLVLERQVQFGGRIGTNLLELRILGEEEFTKFLSRYFKVPAVTPDKIASISDEVLHTIKKELIEKYKVLPLEKHGKRIQIAVINPNDQKMDELSFITGFALVPLVISELRLFYELERRYGIRNERTYIRCIDRFSDEIDPTFSVDTLKAALRDARDREEIVNLLLRAANKVATRVAIFNRLGERILLWKTRGIEVDNIEMTRGESSLFSEVALGGQQLAGVDGHPDMAQQHYYRGPLRDSPGNAAWIKVLGGASPDVLLMPLNVGVNVVAFLYADNGNDEVLDASVAYLWQLATMGSIAFEILRLKERLSVA
jgi:hypothetical protein